MGQECTWSWSGISLNNRWACTAPTFHNVVRNLWNCGDSYIVSAAATSSVQPSGMAHLGGGTEFGALLFHGGRHGGGCQTRHTYIHVSSLLRHSPLRSYHLRNFPTRCRLRQSVRAMFSALQETMVGTPTWRRWGTGCSVSTSTMPDKDSGVDREQKWMKATTQTRETEDESGMRGIDLVDLVNLKPI